MSIQRRRPPGFSSPGATFSFVDLPGAQRRYHPDHRCNADAVRESDALRKPHPHGESNAERGTDSQSDTEREPSATRSPKASRKSRQATDSPTSTGKSPERSAPAEVKAPPQEAPQERDNSSANKVLNLVNQQRSAAGCGPLTLDNRLTQAATAHSQDMSKNNYFAHNSQDGRDPFQRMRDAGYPSPGAENIAQGYADEQAAVDGWMNSPGHRANILNCSLHTMGLGTASSPAKGIYWTQTFGF